MLLNGELVFKLMVHCLKYSGFFQSIQILGTKQTKQKRCKPEAQDVGISKDPVSYWHLV